MMSEAQLLARLNRLAKGWPKGYWLFCNGEMYLMRGDADGNRVYDDHGSIDHDYIVDSIPIPNEGGDF